MKNRIKVIGKKHISLVGTGVFSTSSHQFWMENWGSMTSAPFVGPVRSSWLSSSPCFWNANFADMWLWRKMIKTLVPCSSHQHRWLFWMVITKFHIASGTDSREPLVDNWTWKMLWIASQFSFLQAPRCLKLSSFCVLRFSFPIFYISIISTCLSIVKSRTRC